MTDCPDYYTLADGREFVDFFHQECTPLLVPHFDATEIHCIQSAMEHWFRAGIKTNDMDHDENAFLFWMSKAESFYDERRPELVGTNEFEKHSYPVVGLVLLARLQKWPGNIPPSIHWL